MRWTGEKLVHGSTARNLDGKKMKQSRNNSSNLPHGTSKQKEQKRNGLTRNGGGVWLGTAYAIHISIYIYLSIYVFIYLYIYLPRGW